ncbi:DUF6056 family protein [Pseudobutyrivibrio xylanivorans]|uniref:Glucosyl transferase GtrII n=1 Tax=Pseudobutyrivibrio xylanivorans TaxID=185007 RepID=A0A5P6VSX8_PSEXY|nr:hypothetical protein [Pseudobutyrivibrio xylanivorans]QFJ53951.1 hypothetical protein FXF36_03240 [Pseudobutyrivibrio xylanivorans]
MNKSLSEKIVNCVMGILYVVMIIPMAFSMYNSVPACDDFSFGTRSISDNLLVDAAGYSLWSWKYHSGRWLTFFFQKLINPLNIQRHMGRFYGICDIIVFLIVFAVILYTFRVLLNRLLKLEGTLLNVAIFLIVAVCFTTFYYSEAYNWYIGATAYTVPFACFLLTLTFAVRYEETLQKKFYVGTILAGLIPATNEFFDVPLGVLYLYVVFYVCRCDYKNKKTLINRLIPLIVFMIGGITTVFAPGNFARQDTYEIEPSVPMAVKQIVIDIVVRVKDVVFYHPVAVLLFMGLIILGFKAGHASFKDGNNIILTAVMTFITVFGAVFPYVYGRAMTTTYLDVRMQYLFDYLLFIGIGIGCIRLGRLFRNGKVVIGLAALCVLATAAFVVRGGTKPVIQTDIISKRDLITQSYDYWNGVILEIENSAEDDVVITRTEEPAWSPYFLYMGLVEEDSYDLPLDSIFVDGTIMPNVYYQKKSIKYVIE